MLYVTGLPFEIIIELESCKSKTHFTTSKTNAINQFDLNITGLFFFYMGRSKFLLTLPQYFLSSEPSVFACCHPKS